jgi:anaphase-promoting complex subunit 10
MMDNEDNNNSMPETEEEEPVDDDDTGEEEEEEEDQEGGDEAGGSSGSVLQINAVPNLDSLYGLREIGREALCWQLSSAKPGNGVEQIRDQSTDTYWQSDGVSQPHSIQVHFGRRVALSHVCLYLDYNLDESYTPKHLSIQVGMTTQDLVPAIYPVNTVVELNEPVGWCVSTFLCLLVAKKLAHIFASFAHHYFSKLDYSTHGSSGSAR